MELKTLTLEDKNLINQFLQRKDYSLSSYAFENIIVWGGLYEILWKISQDSLCIFFKDKTGCFLYLPPIGNGFSKEVIKECFSIMDKFNQNPVVSRIENIDNADIESYRNYRIIDGGHEYVCLRKDMVKLGGDRFKSKRSSANFFIKHYDFEFLTYENDHKQECLNLYQDWMDDRKHRNSDSLYQQLLGDNFVVFRNFLEYFDSLDANGLIAKVNNKIKGMTFGYALNNKRFVILFEVCDLEIKGLAQFLFKEFCQRQNFEDINIMDDSGLESLRKVKLSYHPHKIINKFIAVRNE